MRTFDLEVVQGDIIAFLKDPSAPNAVVRLSIGLFVVGVCFLLLPVRKSFFEQCAAAVLKEPLRVILNGFIVCFMLFFLSFIFVLSVLGFPLAAFFALCGVVLCLLGEISVGITIGHFFTEKVKFSENAYSNLAFGVIIIEVVKLVPYAGTFLGCAVLPVVCVGAVSTGFYNAFIKRTLYELPYWREEND